MNPQDPSNSPATAPAVYYLHASGDPMRPAEADDRPPDLPVEVHGQPAAYFWADGIRTGTYVHPSRTFELRVDGARIDGWVRNFRRMRDNGIDVPVPVDHSASARDNLGYVLDVRREEDTLRLLHQLIGEDAIRLASRNKVSLGIDPAFKDGVGRFYGDCVVHSSLTPVPVVPGQEGFVPMADSFANGERAPVLLWMAKTPADPVTPLLDDVRRLTGAAEELAAENALPVLLSWAQGAAARQVEMARSLADAERRASTAEGRVLELSRTTPAIPAELLSSFADLYGRQAEALVQAGHITPACRDRLLALLRPGGRACPQMMPLMLSRRTGDAGVEDRLIDALFAALEQNRALVAGERTGVQILSRAVPGDELPINAGLQQKMVQMANGR